MCYIDNEEKTIPKQDQKTRTTVQTQEERYREERLKSDREEVEKRREHLWEATREIPLKLPQMSISQKGDISVEGEKYARKSKESIGSTKRRVYQNISYSALYKRGQRAEQVENAWRRWHRNRTNIAGRIADLYITRPREEVDAIVQFWSDNEAQNQDLLGDNLHKEIIAQFMEIDLSMDLRTDLVFAEQSYKMEQIVAKSRAFFALYWRNPDMVNGLPEHQARLVHRKMNTIKAFTNYYEIRKKIITNAYYRSHYNSEISYRYHEGDTKEQKNLTLLLWQMESIKNQGYLLDAGTVRAQSDQLKKFRETVGASKEETEDTAKAKQALQMNTPNKIQEANAQMQEEDNILRQGSEQLREAIERLNGPEADNVDLMRALKEKFQDHIQYLYNKYGNGLPLLSAQELSVHREEILKDFEDMEQYGNLLGILRRRGTDVFDPLRDQELQNRYRYYQRWLWAERKARRAFADGMSYSDYKRRAVIEAAHTEANDVSWLSLGQMVEDLVLVNDTGDLDVQWGTFFDEQNVRFHEVLWAFNQKDLVEKGRQIQRESSQNGFQWQMLFEESRKMDPVEAARRFVEKEAQNGVQKERQWWRSLVFSVQSIALQGLGTEDFLDMNQRYREILEQEDLQRQYGLTGPGVMEEYRDFLRRTEDIAEELHTVEYYCGIACDLADEAKKYREMAAGRTEGTQQTQEQKVRVQMYLQLEDSLNKAADEYQARSSEIKLKSLDPLYQQFVAFQERAGMWDQPDHKRLADTVLEPEVEKLGADMTIDIDASGKILQLDHIPLSDMLVGKALRDSQQAGEFEEEIRRYQKIYNRRQIYTKVLEESRQEKQPEGSLWQRLRDGGMSKSGYMIYNLSVRNGLYSKRMNDSLNRINSMLV